MPLEQLISICNDVLASCSDSTIQIFIQILDQIKDYISDSQENYLTKLNFLKESGVFKAFNEILQNPISSDDQLKLLRFYDFLIETCSDINEILILFKDGITNNLISYPFELSSIDVLQSYMTILKGISMKINIIPPDYIFSEKQGRCPLFDHAVAYISHNDSTTIAAARLVVLNMFLSKIPSLIEIISQPATKNQIEHLISVIDADGFAFLVDLMNVAPLEITEFTIEKLRKELMSKDAAFLARAATFLAESRARSMLIEVVSKRIGTFRITEPITLGLILYCLEKRLILSDTAIKVGLLKSGTYTPIPKFNKIAPKTPVRAKMYQELAYVLQHRSSTTVVALALRLFEKLSNGPPNIVTSVRTEIINKLKENLTTEVAELLNSSTIHRQRTDIEYLLSERGEQKRSLQYTLIAQLAEIESAIARWNKKRFSWFVLAENPVQINIPFGIQDGRTVTITANELIVDSDQKYRIWDLSIIPNENKMHKIVTIYVPTAKSRRSSLILSQKEKLHFEFHSFNVAMQFESEIEERQKELSALTLDNVLNQEMN